MKQSKFDRRNSPQSKKQDNFPKAKKLSERQQEMLDTNTILACAALTAFRHTERRLSK